jgi:trans-aconitate 2-methyltransferase
MSVAWTSRLPDSEKPAFVSEVLDRYRRIAAEPSGPENTFEFYQMDVTLVVR